MQAVRWAARTAWTLAVRFPFIRRVLAAAAAWREWAVAALKFGVAAAAVATALVALLTACFVAAVATTAAVHYVWVIDAPFSASLKISMNTAPVLTEPWRWRQHVSYFGDERVEGGLSATSPLLPLLRMRDEGRVEERRRGGNGGGGSGADFGASDRCDGQLQGDGVVEQVLRLVERQQAQAQTLLLLSSAMGGGVGRAAGGGVSGGVASMLLHRSVTHLLATGHVQLLPKHEWSMRHALNTNDDAADDFLFTPVAFSFSDEAEYDIQLRLIMPATSRNRALGPLTATLTLLESDETVPAAAAGSCHGGSGDPLARAVEEEEEEDIVIVDESEGVGRGCAGGAAKPPRQRRMRVVAAAAATASMSARPWVVQWLRELLFVTPLAVFGYAAHDTEQLTFALLDKFNPPMSVLRRIRAVNVTLHAPLAAENPQVEIADAFVDVHVTTWGLTYWFRHYPLLVDAVLVAIFFCINSCITFGVVLAAGLYVVVRMSANGDGDGTLDGSGARAAAATRLMRAGSPHRPRRASPTVQNLRVVNFADAATPQPPHQSRGAKQRSDAAAVSPGGRPESSQPLRPTSAPAHPAAAEGGAWTSEDAEEAAAVSPGAAHPRSAPTSPAAGARPSRRVVGRRPQVMTATASIPCIDSGSD